MPTNLHYKNDLPDIQISSCPSKQGKKYRFNPLAEALVIGVSMLIAILSTTYFIYQHAVDAQKGEFQDGLLLVANQISKYVDGDLHSSFVSRDQESTDNYLRALEPLKKALDGNLIAFVYTVKLKNGKVYFILDPTAEGDLNGDGLDDKSHIMDEYPEATPEMLQALKEQKAVAEPEINEDRWGKFLSGYVPFYNRNGDFVGVLGLDVYADEYTKRFQPIKRASIRAVVTGFFMAFLVGSIVWFMRNFSRVINDRRINLLEDFKIQQTTEDKDEN
jgi:hypothetical protein